MATGDSRELEFVLRFRSEADQAFNETRQGLSGIASGADTAAAELAKANLALSKISSNDGKIQTSAVLLGQLREAAQFLDQTLGGITAFDLDVDTSKLATVAPLVREAQEEMTKLRATVAAADSAPPDQLVATTKALGEQVVVTTRAVEKLGVELGAQGAQFSGLSDSISRAGQRAADLLQSVRAEVGDSAFAKLTADANTLQEQLVAVRRGVEETLPELERIGDVKGIADASQALAVIDTLITELSLKLPLPPIFSPEDRKLLTSGPIQRKPLLLGPGRPPDDGIPGTPVFPTAEEPFGTPVHFEPPKVKPPDLDETITSMRVLKDTTEAVAEAAKRVGSQEAFAPIQAQIPKLKEELEATAVALEAMAAAALAAGDSKKFVELDKAAKTARGQIEKLTEAELNAGTAGELSFGKVLTQVANVGKLLRSIRPLLSGFGLGFLFTEAFSLVRKFFEESQKDAREFKEEMKRVDDATQDAVRSVERLRFSPTLEHQIDLLPSAVAGLNKLRQEAVELEADFTRANQRASELATQFQTAEGRASLPVGAVREFLQERTKVEEQGKRLAKIQKEIADAESDPHTVELRQQEQAFRALASQATAFADSVIKGIDAIHGLGSATKSLIGDLPSANVKLRVDAEDAARQAAVIRRGIDQNLSHDEIELQLRFSVSGAAGRITVGDYVQDLLRQLNELKREAATIPKGEVGRDARERNTDAQAKVRDELANAEAIKKTVAAHNEAVDASQRRERALAGERKALDDKGKAEQAALQAAKEAKKGTDDLIVENQALRDAIQQQIPLELALARARQQAELAKITDPEEKARRAATIRDNETLTVVYHRQEEQLHDLRTQHDELVKSRLQFREQYAQDRGALEAQITLLGVSNKEREHATELIREVNAAVAAGITEPKQLQTIIDEYDQLLTVTDKLTRASQTFARGWADAADRFADSVENAADRGARAFDTFEGGLEDVLVKLGMGEAKPEDFERFVKGVAAENLRSTIRQGLAGVLKPGGQEGTIDPRSAAGIEAKNALARRQEDQRLEREALKQIVGDPIVRALQVQDQTLPGTLRSEITLPLSEVLRGTQQLSPNASAQPATLPATQAVPGAVDGVAGLREEIEQSTASRGPELTDRVTTPLLEALRGVSASASGTAVITPAGEVVPPPTVKPGGLTASGGAAGGQGGFLAGLQSFLRSETFGKLTGIAGQAGTLAFQLAALFEEGGISDAPRKRLRVPAMSFDGATHFARGGVTAGDPNGIPAILHPNEAVIPLTDDGSVPLRRDGRVALPDGRSIPTLAEGAANTSSLLDYLTYWLASGLSSLPETLGTIGGVSGAGGAAYRNRLYDKMGEGSPYPAPHEDVGDAYERGFGEAPLAKKARALRERTGQGLSPLATTVLDIAAPSPLGAAMKLVGATKIAGVAFIPMLSPALKGEGKVAASLVGLEDVRKTGLFGVARNHLGALDDLEKKIGRALTEQELGSLFEGFLSHSGKILSRKDATKLFGANISEQVVGETAADLQHALDEGQGINIDRMFQPIREVLGEDLYRQEYERLIGPFPGKPEFARGGLTIGPASGIPAVLHPNEAVIPLNQDQEIPLAMRNGKLVAKLPGLGRYVKLAAPEFYDGGMLMNQGAFIAGAGYSNPGPTVGGYGGGGTGGYGGYLDTASSALGLVSGILSIINASKGPKTKSRTTYSPGRRGIGLNPDAVNEEIGNDPQITKMVLAARREAMTEAFGAQQASSHPGGVNVGIPLRPFAEGGVAYLPTNARIAERVPEAVVPLSGGRSIPVEVRGGGGGSSPMPDSAAVAIAARPVQVTMNIVTQDAGSFRQSRGQILTETAAGLDRAARRNV